MNIGNRRQRSLEALVSPANRCPLPLTWFSEYDTSDGKKVPVWFAAGDDRPLVAFADLWTPRTSVRKRRRGLDQLLWLPHR
jgi:putative SOS response-associated peptidase YedK